MINNIYEYVANLWQSLISLPLEWQVVAGIGVLAAFNASKTLWTILSPVRWVLATSLRTLAWGLHRDSHKSKGTVFIPEAIERERNGKIKQRFPAKKKDLYPTREVVAEDNYSVKYPKTNFPTYHSHPNGMPKNLYGPIY